MIVLPFVYILGFIGKAISKAVGMDEKQRIKKYDTALREKLKTTGKENVKNHLQTMNNFKVIVKECTAFANKYIKTLPDRIDWNKLKEYNITKEECIKRKIIVNVISEQDFICELIDWLSLNYEKKSVVLPKEAYTFIEVIDYEELNTLSYEKNNGDVWDYVYPIFADNVYGDGLADDLAEKSLVSKLKRHGLTDCYFDSLGWESEGIFFEMNFETMTGGNISVNNQQNS